MRKTVPMNGLVFALMLSLSVALSPLGSKEGLAESNTSQDSSSFAGIETGASRDSTADSGLMEPSTTQLDTVWNPLHDQAAFKRFLLEGGSVLLLILIAVAAFWLMRYGFPKLYLLVERWEGRVIRPIKIRKMMLLKAESLTAFAIVILKGIRLCLSLAIIYFIIVYLFSVIPWTRAWNVRSLVGAILLSFLVSIFAYVLFRAIASFFGMLRRKIPGWKGTAIKPLKLKSAVLLSEDRIVEFLSVAIKIPHFVSYVFLFYFYLATVFSFFRPTRTWAATLVSYFLSPLQSVFTSFVNYLPNIFFIIVIAVITRYVLKFIRLIFREIERGTLALPGFYQEWAGPTYKIVRFMVIALAAIVVFPYLPGSKSPAFQGISIFLGVLFSLGSTSAIANMVAGVVLTYMRPFKVGDRVKIADTVGDIIEKTLLVTRVRTIKNVDIAVPNSMVMGSHIINFSSSAQERGLILHTSVTIGYDAPWRKVTELLIGAAIDTEHILEKPEPFVLQTSLDDFFVTYELNAYTDQPNIMAKTYSDLHQNIQDKFYEAGVEIMSPHYSALRDGNKMAIPDKYLPKSYLPSSFRVTDLTRKAGRQEPGKGEDET